MVTPELIISIVAEHFHISETDIKGTKRNSEIVFPRQIAMYLCREMTNTPLKSVGKYLGGKDHSTIINGCKKIVSEMESSESVRNTIEVIKKKNQSKLILPLRHLGLHETL